MASQFLLGRWEWLLKFYVFFFYQHTTDFQLKKRSSQQIFYYQIKNWLTGRLWRLENWKKRRRRSKLCKKDPEPPESGDIHKWPNERRSKDLLPLQCNVQKSMSLHNSLENGELMALWRALDPSEGTILRCFNRSANLINGFSNANSHLGFYLPPQSLFFPYSPLDCFP